MISLGKPLLSNCKVSDSHWHCTALCTWAVTLCLETAFKCTDENFSRQVFSPELCQLSLYYSGQSHASFLAQTKHAMEVKGIEDMDSVCTADFQMLANSFQINHLLFFPHCVMTGANLESVSVGYMHYHFSVETRCRSDTGAKCRMKV